MATATGPRRQVRAATGDGVEGPDGEVDRSVRQPALPLWRHVVFVDWHDVLSRTPFWASIVTDRGHPLNRPLRTRLGRLYGDAALMTAWMTGRSPTADVVDALGVQGAPRYDTDYLCRHLAKDVREMRVNRDLLPVLAWARERAFVVVATDNVDPFAREFRRLAGRRETRTAGQPEPIADPDDSLAAAAGAFDDLLCSSDVGALKTAPEAFYGSYLAACGLTFADALLVDDRSDNCTAFRAAGGAALRWTMHADPVTAVAAVVHAWLGGAPDLRGPAPSAGLVPTSRTALSPSLG